jgi:hypothetical protein
MITRSLIPRYYSHFRLGISGTLFLTDVPQVPACQVNPRVLPKERTRELWARERPFGDIVLLQFH